MALNVKRLFPLDHPPVTYPEKPPFLQASTDESIDLKRNKRDNLQEKFMDERVKKEREAFKNKVKSLNII
ncbi:hypothetical protein OAT67_06835 [Bacteriovoracaceae bacterium]|nr:hypothetical protein [Bacteriovoracaceae bacterium]|tara:strand:+ start:349120 stop:349329 length:210 start_codon:yes stop_codon:yes gene_type:complete